MDPENLEVIMHLIMHGGDAKGKSIEAIQAAKQGDFSLANVKLKEADEALTQAHRSQTGLLSEEASNNVVSLSLLMVHGQDHLMTAIVFNDIAKEIVYLYEKIEKI